MPYQNINPRDHPGPHRKILHLDLDAFYCAVEEQKNPSLIGKPFAVGGRPDERGVVSSCSYSARRTGVHSAMPMARALKLCPELIIVPSSYKAYSQASRHVMDRLQKMTPHVEQISIDEAFLDVSDLPEPGADLARRLQETIRGELGLPCSLGVASNKLVAKIANDVGKSTAHHEGPPNAITVVPPGQEAIFLAPLPVEALLGVGPKTAERLAELEIYTIGQLASYPVAGLERRFGKIGLELSIHAQGIDERPIVTFHEPKSISQETTFAHDVSDEEYLHNMLRALSESVGRRLRKANRTGTAIKLKLRWPDFTTLTRQITLRYPTNQDNQIYEAVLHLFEKNWKRGRAVRLVGVGVSGLGPPSRQLSLWGDDFEFESEKERKLQTAVDILRDRFGNKIIRRASDLETFPK